VSKEGISNTSDEAVLMVESEDILSSIFWTAVNDDEAGLNLGGLNLSKSGSRVVANVEVSEATSLAEHPVITFASVSFGKEFIERIEVLFRAQTGTDNHVTAEINDSKEIGELLQ
jgi:hypothetical protein